SQLRPRSLPFFFCTSALPDVRVVISAIGSTPVPLRDNSLYARRRRGSILENITARSPKKVRARKLRPLLKQSALHSPDPPSLAKVSRLASLILFSYNLK